LTPTGQPEPTHLRLGSSHCANLLPGADELGRSADDADRRGLILELVVPPVGDADLERVRGLLALLRGRPTPARVVVNDLGALKVASDDSQYFQVVAGRLINRQMKDPRLPLVERSRLGGWPAAWGLGSATSAAWVALMRRLGVVGAELDWPAHGLDEAAWAAVELPLVLHLPWVLVACGRTCISRDPRGPVDRTAAGEACALDCRSGALELEPEGECRRIRRGNAELLRLPAATVGHARSWATAAGVRVVWNARETTR
jgi:hypothetical protein